MLYHKLLQLTEKHLPTFGQVVRAAVVFHCDITPHQTLSRSWDEDKQRRLMQEFRLPYDIIAIEDAANCIILADVNAGQVGLNRWRIYVECVAADAMNNSDGYSDPIDEKLALNDLMQDAPPGSIYVSMGKMICAGVREKQYRLGGMAWGAIGGSADNLTFRLVNLGVENPVSQMLTSQGVKNAMTTIEELIHVEERPGFKGWPRGEMSLLQQLFEIKPDGEIVASDRCAR